MRLSRANMPLASGYGAWCQALSGFHCKNLAPHFPLGFINLQYFCHSRWRNPVRLSKSGQSGDPPELDGVDVLERVEVDDHAALALRDLFRPNTVPIARAWRTVHVFRLHAAALLE